MLYTILVIVLLLALLGAWPGVGFAPASWGYYGSGGAGLLLLVLLVVIVMERRV